MVRPAAHDVPRQSARIRRIRAAARRSLVLAAVSGFAALGLLVFAFVPGTSARFYDAQPLGMESISTGQLAVAPVDGQLSAVLWSRQRTPKSRSRVFTDGDRSVECSKATRRGFKFRCPFPPDKIDLLTVSGGDDIEYSQVFSLTVHGKNLMAQPKATVDKQLSGLPAGTTLSEPVVERVSGPDVAASVITVVEDGDEFAEQDEPYYLKVTYTVSLKAARCDSIVCGEVSEALLPEITFIAQEADRQ
ncbi:hypothetical protein ACFSSC_09985 [Corynebacterium mendelii]|uniref:Uncharacterized protein n=1 Tax=Corynebacterium mendelii TaxID=2765362 RepID=A0A939E0I1_9CORY|nr:hypothetical protein [Corynebacterium mendelii]MBN9644428.1 hypothetical protein [Corynebacterium mendelii]